MTDSQSFLLAATICWHAFCVAPDRFKCGAAGALAIVFILGAALTKL